MLLQRNFMSISKLKIQKNVGDPTQNETSIKKLIELG